MAICDRVLLLRELESGPLGSFVVDKNYDMGGMVREFYHRFEQDEFVAPAGEVASVERMGAGRTALRVDLIGEEFIELVDATYGVEAGNVLRGALERVRSENGYEAHQVDTVEVADALADIMYLVWGFALEAGIPLMDVFREVHASNMSKLGEDGKPIISDGTMLRSDGSPAPVGKLKKGADFFPPDIKGVLGLNQNDHP